MQYRENDPTVGMHVITKYLREHGFNVAVVWWLFFYNAMRLITAYNMCSKHIMLASRVYAMQKFDGLSGLRVPRPN